MVVCKCRKATKLYCFVHKVPVCGECICFPEHHICVVRTYSEWVIDGDYDFPTSCTLCQLVFDDGAATTRLGCLHIVHTHCLVSHLQSFPPHTAPAGYVCPDCSSPIWPPKSIKDSGSVLHTKLKEAISQSGLAKNLLGNDWTSGQLHEPRTTPPAFASDPLVSTVSSRLEGNTNADPLLATTKELNASVDSTTTAFHGSHTPPTRSGNSSVASSDIVEIDGAGSVRPNLEVTHDPRFLKSQNAAGVSPGATTRKGSYRGDKYISTFSSYEDDDDEYKRKYTRRGHLHNKFFRFLLPFWSPALPTLPVTAPRKEDRDGLVTDELIEGHSRRRRSSTVDPRRILLFIAIMSCMATMMLLYYRLSQSSGSEELPEEDQQ